MRSASFAVLLVVVLGAGCGERASGEPPFPQPGSRAPDFSLPRYGSAQPPVRLSDERGKVVLVTFWASWCGPCAEEMPELSQLADKYRDEGLVVYGILHDDKPATALSWMRERGVSIPLLISPDKAVATAYGLRGLPDAYLIGRDGRLLHWQQGYPGPGLWEPRVQAALAR